LGFLAKASAPGVLAVEAINARIDAAVAALFLVLVAVVVVSAGRQWLRVLNGSLPIEPDDPPRGGGGSPPLGEVPAVGGRTRCC
jgi:hypothetical protein